MTQEDTERADAAQDGDKQTSPTRYWTQRFTGDLKFDRYTQRDGGGRLRICFSFHLPPGVVDLPPDVYRVFNTHKRDDVDGYSNGMRFRNDPVRGKTFSLPNHERGRAIADRIDMILLELGARLDKKRGPGR